MVVYEDLCAHPTEQAKAILAFAGLPWDGQTERFLARSTRHDGPAGYYAVIRDSVAAAERWRTSMAPSDQEAVRDVVRGSPLTRYWADLAV